MLHLTQDQLKQAFVLKPNRVLRTYRGGLLLEAFRRYPNPRDSCAPEDWLGSTTASRLKTHPNEGLSLVSVGDRELMLDDVIKQYPREMLGEKHVEVFGAHPFLLAKLLDSCERLRVQVHPSRQQALSLFGSRHGKAEAWYILETRSINGVPPYILLGFREGVRALDFKEALLNRDTESLIAMMHRVDVRPGDIFMVDAGVPHAIGSGVLMLEIQEPSDLTIYAEANGQDAPLEHSSNHLGLGWERALDLFQYQGDSPEGNLAKRRLVPIVSEGAQVSVYETMMGDPDQPYFGLTEFVVRGRTELEMETYTIAIAVQGRGSMEVGGRRWTINQGDVMFWPAILGEFTLSTEAEQTPLRLLCCRPPSHYL
ncbi:MAG TPA: hypothetical protein DDZ66_02835 [Firmicutes bacterium]|nr:hypothetical protein [Bacillota bacterium]